MSSESIDAETLVFVASTLKRSSRKTFHLSKDCSALVRATSVIEKRRGVLGDSVTCCKFCDGTAQPSRENDRSAYDAAVAASPEAIFDG